MDKTIHSSLIFVNFCEFQDNLDTAFQLEFNKNVFLQVFLTLAPSFTQVFSHFSQNETAYHNEFFNKMLDFIEQNSSSVEKQNLIYDFITVAKTDVTEINLGFSFSGFYISVVSAKQCTDQQLVSNYIQGQFFENFLKTTLEDVTRYDAILNLQKEKVIAFFKTATLTTVPNDVYPIPFRPLVTFKSKLNDLEENKDKIRKIFANLISLKGE